MSSVPSWAAGSVIHAAVLLSPVFAFLMAIAAEILIDLLIEAPALLALAAAGVIGWSLRRKRWPHPDAAPHLEHDPSLEDPAAIAAPPG